VTQRSALKIPGSGKSTGDLTIHGRTKKVPFDYSIKQESGGFGVVGKLHVNIQDFGIAVPSYLGVTVKPDVEVETHFTVSEQ
jgi:polyisoprenoid-binding protein YceI